MSRPFLTFILAAGGLLFTAAFAMASLIELKGDFVTIGEPTTMLVFGIGLIGLASYTRKMFLRN